jgi:hypothetical protein
MAKGANVEVKGFSRFEAVDNLFVSGTIVTSGSMQLGLSLIDSDSHLILSSSAGSMIVVSGNLNVLGSIQQNGAALAFDVTGAGDFFVTNTLTAPKITDTSTPAYIINGGAWGSEVDLNDSMQIKWANSSNAADTKDLALARQSAGVLRITNGSDGSGSLLIHNLQVSGSVAALKSHLVLSSSVGSQITVSGTTLNVFNNAQTSAMVQVENPNTGVGGLTTFRLKAGGANKFSLQAQGNADTVNYVAEAAAGGTHNFYTNDNSTTDIRFRIDNNGKAFFQRAVYSDTRLILSSSGGSVVAVSGVLNIEPPVAGRGAKLQSANGWGITGLAVTDENGNRTANFVIDGAVHYSNGGGAFDMIVGRGGVGGGSTSASGIHVSSIHVVKWAGGTLMSSPEGHVTIGRLDSGSLYISGSSGRNMLVGKDGHLILSSAIGSIVYVSGGLTTLGAISAGSQTILGGILINQGATTAITTAGVNVGSATSLNFGNNSPQSSTVEVKFRRIAGQTSTVAMSGASGSVCFASENGHLILSSSAGSTVHISGTMFSVGDSRFNLQPDTSTPLIQFDTSDIVFYSRSADELIYSFGGSHRLGLDLTALRLKSGVRLLGENQHVVLSSSNGRIRVSGTLGLEKASSTALPAGDENLSGSIIWVNDLKQFAIYGPAGWVRITTGSVVS